MSGALPNGACDSHCHVFGPAAAFPWAANRTYTPEEAPKEKLFALHRELGFDHAVIVQPAVHGFDNSVTLDAIAASGRAYRGVALVKDDISRDEIAALHAGGIRGVRFNFVHHLSPPPESAAFRRVVERIAPFDWHILLHVTTNDIETALPYVRNLDMPFVIDHMGRIPASMGLESRPYQLLLEILSGSRAWIKISGGDRISEGAPYHDVIPIARALTEAAPGRVLWGTDFPHPNIKGPMPKESDLLALLRLVAPEPKLFHQILVDNPERLYRFRED